MESSQQPVQVTSPNEILARVNEALSGYRQNRQCLSNDDSSLTGWRLKAQDYLLDGDFTTTDPACERGTELGRVKNRGFPRGNPMIAQNSRLLSRYR